MLCQGCESHTSPDSARSAARWSFWLSTMALHRAAAALPTHWKPSSHSGVDDELMADTRPVDTDRNRSDAACDSCQIGHHRPSSSCCCCAEASARCR